jgi:hypothetical protein
MVLAQKQTHRSMGQNRGPKNNPLGYSHLVFNKDAQNILWRKDSLFNK